MMEMMLPLNKRAAQSWPFPSQKQMAKKLDKLTLRSTKFKLAGKNYRQTPLVTASQKRNWQLLRMRGAIGSLEQLGRELQINDAWFLTKIRSVQTEMTFKINNNYDLFKQTYKKSPLDKEPKP